MTEQITEREYREHIDDLTDIIIDEWEDYKDSYGDIYEMIWETVDSDSWIIYNSYHLGVISNSPTTLSNVEWQVYVDFNEANYLDVFQAMAFALMEMDLIEAIRKERSDLS